MRNTDFLEKLEAIKPIIKNYFLKKDPHTPIETDVILNTIEQGKILTLDKSTIYDLYCALSQNKGRSSKIGYMREMLYYFYEYKKNI